MTNSDYLVFLSVLLIITFLPSELLSFSSTECQRTIKLIFNKLLRNTSWILMFPLNCEAMAAPQTNGLLNRCHLLIMWKAHITQYCLHLYNHSDVTKNWLIKTQIVAIFFTTSYTQSFTNTHTKILNPCFKNAFPLFNCFDMNDLVLISSL